MAYLSPGNDTRVNLLLLLADLHPARAGSPTQPGAGTTPEAPLFLWEQLMDRLGTPADRATLRDNEAGGQSAPGTSAPAAGNDAFTMAVGADRSLRPEEREALLLARKSDRAGDAAGAIASAERVATTPSAKEYARYLQGAAAFWHADYERAAATFRSLEKAQTGWVRETATYMIGRTLINQAQVGAFDEYGSFNQKWHADASVVRDAEKALDTYLEQSPKGTYAQSARGLKRRGYWLAQDTGKLEEEYGALLLLAPEERNSSDAELVQEIDNKIVTPPASFDSPRDGTAEEALLRGAQSPLLLAMLDLQAMRTATAEDGATGSAAPSSPLSLAALQEQRPRFGSQKPLYDYLLAVHAFYVEGRPAEALRLLPDAARQSSFSAVEFSRQMLRGLALEAVKDRNALGFWTQLLPGAKGAFQEPLLQLAIAHHEERAGELQRVFAPASPVRYPYLREVLLANVADAALLRAQAKNAGVPKRERDLALFTLLYKEATRGKAAEFLEDLALVPPKAPTEGDFQLDDIADSYYLPDSPQQRPDVPLGIFVHNRTDAHFACPNLRATEEQLAKNANDPSAQLCLADFVRLHASLSYLQTTKIPASDLGGTPSLFPGGPFVRMATYTAVLSNARSGREDKAYALYRAVNCYAPSGLNDCGGDDVPKEQRKAWFTTLKHDYADTRWARALEFYW